MSFGPCEGRGVLVGSTAVGFVCTSQRTYPLSESDKGRFNYRREKSWSQVCDIIANITCSKGRRHASWTSLTIDLEQTALPFSFKDYLIY